MSQIHRVVVGALWPFLLVSGACSFEDRCSENQTINPSGYCECTTGTVPNDAKTACVPCPDHEVVEGASCVCEPGFKRDDDGTCVELGSASGLDAPCDTATSPCLDSAYPLCRPISATLGYCTAVDCAAGQTCPDGFSCREQAGASFCERPPIGQGATCSVNADCAGTEAQLCDSLVSNTCLVIGCNSSPDTCIDGWECCDLNALGIGNVCAPIGMCLL